MSIFTKNILSEETLLTWLVYTFAATLFSILVFSIIVYIQFDCWPLSRYQFESGICLENIQPHYMKFIPIALGFFLGVILTIKLKK